MSQRAIAKEVFGNARAPAGRTDRRLATAHGDRYGDANEKAPFPGLFQ